MPREPQGVDGTPDTRNRGVDGFSGNVLDHRDAAERKAPFAAAPAS